MPTILIIDDSPAQRTALRTVLCESGLCDRVLEAEDGIEGLKLLKSSSPDLVLCDVEMPRLGGDKLLAFASAPETKRTPFLMLTAMDDPARRTALLERGARDVIAKSVGSREIVARVGLHLELARLERELSERNELLERLATIDPLTRLRNRRFVDEALQLEWKRSQRQNTPFSVVMADIDHFKRVNDQHGHPMGDRVLSEVAASLARRVRATDTLGRYGGEEFIAVVASPLEGARVLAEHWRREIESLRIEATDGAPITPTLSLGVATRTPSCPTPDAVVAAADAALYAAKLGGRNRVASAPSAGAPRALIVMAD